MAVHNINPVRDQLRCEILSALAVGQDPMTTGDLYLACPSATSAEEVSRVCYELRKKNLIADGGKVPHPRGSPVNSYRLPNTDDPRIEAAKPIVVERKIPRTIKPPKPAQDHPFKARIVAQEAHDGAPRVTRPLPSHLQSTAPQLAAEGIHHHILEEAMSEDPLAYIPDPDSFALAPKEPEAKEDIDSELIDALQGLAEFVPLPQADDDLTDLAPKKICKCIRLNKLPSLPSAYRYASMAVEIVSEHDCETLTLRILDEGAGPFVEIDTTGRLRFDRGELALISQAWDAFIEMMETDHE